MTSTDPGSTLSVGLAVVGTVVLVAGLRPAVHFVAGAGQEQVLVIGIDGEDNDRRAGVDRRLILAVVGRGLFFVRLVDLVAVIAGIVAAVANGHGQRIEGTGVDLNVLGIRLRLAVRREGFDELVGAGVDSVLEQQEGRAVFAVVVASQA